MTGFGVNSVDRDVCPLRRDGAGTGRSADIDRMGSSRPHRLLWPAQTVNLLVGLRGALYPNLFYITSVRFSADPVAVVYLGVIVEITSSAALFRHPLHVPPGCCFSHPRSRGPAAMLDRPAGPDVLWRWPAGRVP